MVLLQRSSNHHVEQEPNAVSRHPRVGIRWLSCRPPCVFGRVSGVILFGGVVGYSLAPKYEVWQERESSREEREKALKRKELDRGQMGYDRA
jgi:hypothetical protein